MTFTKYIEARKKADSVQKMEGQLCQVIAGSNGGYFIEAFGLSYRFACVEDPQEIARLFLDIVAIGPIDEVDWQTCCKFSQPHWK